MSLLDEFEQGIGTFSPFALSSEKKFARQVGPALANVLGDQIRAGADVEGNRLRTQGMLTATGMKESGDTFRQRLVNDAQILMRDMMEKGALTREGMSQSGQTQRTGMQEAGATGRVDLQGRYNTSLQKDLFRLQGDRDDNLAITKMRVLDKYNQTASPERTGGVVDAIESPAPAKEKKFSPSSFGSILPFEDYLDEGTGTW